MREARTVDDKKLLKLTNNMLLYFPLFHRKLIQTENSCHIITPFNPRFKVMGILLFYGPMQMSDISKKICASKPNTTAVINNLIKDKLVKRVYDKKDRRTIHIELTGKGRQSLTKSRDETMKTIKTNISKLSKDDFDRLYRSLEDMTTILSKINKNENMKHIVDSL